jgi:hypothetical protein
VGLQYVVKEIARLELIEEGKWSDDEEDEYSEYSESDDDFLEEESLSDAIERIIGELDENIAFKNFDELINEMDLNELLDQLLLDESGDLELYDEMQLKVDEKTN